MNRRVLFLLILLCLLTIMLHLYKMGVIPPGIDNDETLKAYDAYSLILTGKDQWNNTVPMVFKGFGGYTIELYTYTIVPAIALFGLSTYAVRFPGLLISLSSVLGTYYLGKKLFNRTTGFTAAFLLSLSPWFIGMTRIGIEAPLGSMFMIYGTLFFLSGLKKLKWLIFSLLFFLLAMYTYHAFRLIVPVFILILCLIHLKYVIQNKKIFLGLGLLFIFLLFPLVFLIFHENAGVRYGQIIFTKDVGIVNRVNEARSLCDTQILPIICRVVHSKVTEFTFTYAQYYLAHFSPQILFITGFQSTLAVMPPNGLFLQIEVVLFIIGMIYFFRTRNKNSLIIISWLLLSPIPDSFTGSEHYHRFFIVFPSIQLVSAFGLYKIKNISGVKYIISVIVCALVFLFIGKYFGSFGPMYSRLNHYEYRPLFTKLLQIEKKYPAIYISRKEFDTKQYVYYLFFNKYDPVSYQNNIDVERTDGVDGWVSVKRIGKWHFVDTLPESVAIPDNSLVVGAGSEFNNHGTFPLAKTYMLDGREAFYIFRNCTQQERMRMTEATKSGELIQPKCYY